MVATENNALLDEVIDCAQGLGYMTRFCPNIKGYLASLVKEGEDIVEKKMGKGRGKVMVIWDYSD